MKQFAQSMRGLKQVLAAGTLAGVSTCVLAAGQHAGGHSGQMIVAKNDMDMGSMRMESLDMSQMKALPVQPDDAPSGHAGHGVHGGHAHDFWVEPPQDFAERTYGQWDNFERAKAGMEIYRDHCAGCHGIDGRGSGPLASKLKHAPADLTNHFHNAAGDGDQYLFWRVTEGGAVEPFASQDSAMPAFKHSLTEGQRWDVLAYVHQAFHRGFKRMMGMDGSGSQHGHGSHH